MPRQNSLKSRIRNFGDNFVDSVTLPELEFHTGHVQQVINNKRDLRSVDRKLKSRIPKNPNGVILIKATKGALPTLGSSIVASPLLRGISDSVAKGDLVIFCNIANQSYYLGPINTTNSVYKTPNPLNTIKKNILEDERKQNLDGYSINFPPQLRPVEKLQKSYLPDTDFPQNSLAGDPGTTVYHEGSFSDVVLDGRFGNSIRIGSRHANPILNVHNGRYSSLEDLNQGSLISMISVGSLNDHFVLNQDFRLAYDRVAFSDGNNKNIGFGNDSVGGEPFKGSQDNFNYNYGALENIQNRQGDNRNQIIMFSDKITFDARDNDFTVSALRNINFGAGGNFTITNKGFSVIETENIYIGKEAKNKAQPMVLGDELRILLLEIMTILFDSRALVQGVPIPLTDSNSAPMLQRIQDVIDKLQPREVDQRTNLPTPGSGGGTRFLSHYHYLEQNIRGQE